MRIETSRAAAQRTPIEVETRGGANGTVLAEALSAGRARGHRRDQYRSLPDLMEDSFRTYAQRDAFVFMDHALTYAEVDRLSAAFGAWLQGHGLARGARVAIMMPNVLQYPVALAGVLRAGYVVVNVNPLYTPRELEHQLKDSGAEAIVILENFAVTLQQVVARTAIKHVIVTSIGDLLGFPKGAVVNFAVRRIKKMVPSYSLPGHLRFSDVLEQGRDSRSHRCRSARTTSRSCSTPAARPASPRARC